MPLHLAHHKSYHVYNQANIDRVRADEEKARLEEEGKEARGLVAVSKKFCSLQVRVCLPL